MEQTLIYIDDKQKYDASVAANSYMDKNTKNRTYINVLGAELAMKYLASENIDVSETKNLHSIKKILEEFDISDIRLKNINIDVRVVYNEKEIFIPKSHFEYNLIPDIYIVFKLDNDISNVEFLGFFEPKLINKNNANKDYYFIEKEKLSSPADLAKFIGNYTSTKDENLSDEDTLENLFVSMIDNDISEQDKKYLIENLVKSSQLRDKFIEYENFETLSYKAMHDSSIDKHEPASDVSSVDEFDMFENEQKDNSQENNIVETVLDAGIVAGGIAGVVGAAGLGEIENLDELADLAQIEESDKEETKEIADEDIEIVEETSFSDEDNLSDNIVSDEDVSIDAQSFNQTDDEIKEELEETPVGLDDVVNSDEISEELPVEDSIGSEEILEEDSPIKLDDVINPDEISDDLPAETEDFINSDEIQEEELPIELNEDANTDEASEEDLSNEEVLNLDMEASNVELDEVSAETVSEEVVSLDIPKSGKEDAALAEEDYENHTDTSFENIDAQTDAPEEENISLDSIETIQNEESQEISEDNQDTETFGKNLMENLLSEEVSDVSLEELDASSTDVSDISSDDLLSQIDDVLNSSTQDEESVAEEEAEPSTETDKTEKSFVEDEETQESAISEKADGIEGLENLEEITQTEEIDEESKSQEVYEPQDYVESLLDDDKDDSEDNPDKLNVLYSETEQVENEEPVEEIQEEIQEEAVLVQKNNKPLMLAAVVVTVAALAVATTFGYIKSRGEKTADIETLPNTTATDVPADINAENNILESNAPKADKPSSDSNVKKAEKELKNTPKQTPVKGAYMSVSRIVWDVPDTLSYSPRIQNYLRTAGKSIKISLSTDLLLTNDYAYTNSVKVLLNLSKDGSVKSSKVIQGSGSTEIDNIVLQSVKETLSVIKPPATDLKGQDFNLNLIIYF